MSVRVMIYRPHRRTAASRSVARVLAALLIFALLASAAFAAPLWTHKPESSIKWYRVTGLGSVLIGTKKAMYALDGEDGRVLWTRDDLGNFEEFEVNLIADTPFAFASRNSGSFQKSTRLYAIDLLTGQSVWETDKLKGSTIAVEPIHEKDLVLLLTVENNSADKGKPKITALRLTTGELVWESDFPSRVDLYGIERGSKFYPKFDLSGANPPIYDDDSVYFTYDGLHRFSLADGKLIWGVEYDVTEGRIERGNAQAIIDGDTIYTSAKGQVRAIDKQTGAVKWTSKDFGGAIAEMRLLDGVIYGRLGGAFYDFGKREYVNKKPFGVAAIDQQTGATNWYYEGAKDSITNLVVLPELQTVLISDAKNLIALDTASKGKVKESYKVKLEFKHKLGAAGTAAKVAKFGLGGFSAFGKGGADTTDEPVALYRRENGTVVVQGKQHMLAFDPRSRQIAWSVKYPAPGMPGWQNIVMAGLTAVTYTANSAMAANTAFSYSTRRSANDSAVDALVSYEKFVTKRFSAAKAHGSYVYILTTVREGKEKGAGIVGVNMETGRGERQILFKDKEPDYQVDEWTGRVFNLRNDKELSAFALDAMTEADDDN